MRVMLIESAILLHEKFTPRSYWPANSARERTQELGNSGTRELGNSGTRELGNSGTRELGNSGTRELGNSGTRELGNSGTRELGNSETRKLRNLGTQELENSGTQELRNSETQELRNSGWPLEGSVHLTSKHWRIKSIKIWPLRKQYKTTKTTENRGQDKSANSSWGVGEKGLW